MNSCDVTHTHCIILMLVLSVVLSTYFSKFSGEFMINLMVTKVTNHADPRLCKLPFQEVVMRKQDSSKYLKGIKSTAGHSLFVLTMAESTEGVAIEGLYWFRTNFRV
ncbi:hypothetical protein Droror1_Dr00023020 [Drosera rotundifolia]